MDPLTIGLAGIACMLLLFLTGMPVAYVMMSVGFAGFCVLRSWSAGINQLAQSFYETFGADSLSTIPLFILMGQLAFHSGISQRLYDTAYHFSGAVRGGLAMATVAACSAFGAVCGSGPATAATMATVGLAQMKRYGYANSLASGSIAAGGGLGMIMPPSVVLIVYGILTSQSVGKLFVAGIVPALLLTALFMLTVFLQCLHNPQLGPRGSSFSWTKKLRSLAGVLDTLFIFFLVIGGIFLGWFTPVKAAAIGVFLVLILGLITRRMTWQHIVHSLFETLGTATMVLFLIAGATIFGKFLSVTRIPYEAGTWIAGLDVSALSVMICIIAIYFIGGCVMDALALVMLTIPVFFPVIVQLGYDPLWFGVLIVLVTQMGVITPPVGINVYVVFGVARKVVPGITLQEIFQGTTLFLIPLFIGLVLLFLFPDIILFLPALMY